MAFCHVAFQCLPEVLNSPLFKDLLRGVKTFVDIIFGQTKYVINMISVNNMYIYIGVHCRSISKQKINEEIAQLVEHH